MKSRQRDKTVHERVLETACDLFYRQGYRATGVNQIIAESGVAKASFYLHFSSKDDLLLAYVKEMSRREIAELREEVMAFPTVRERLYGPLKILAPWFEGTGFRGCPFQNVSAEMPENRPEIQAALAMHREQERLLFLALVKDFAAETPGMSKVDTEAFAESYLLLFEGAIVLATACRSIWPVVRAEQTLGCWIDHFLVCS